MLKIFLFFCFFCLSSQVSIEEAFTKHGVVTDVIPKAPKDLLKVTFDSGVEANLGEELTPTQVKNEPKIDWAADSNTLYTVVMTDPDAPSRIKPIKGEWRHWLIINVKGKDLSTGKTISEYVGAGPPPATDLHRYVLLIYKQANQITDDIPTQSNKTALNRELFKISDFAKKYNLGDPLFGNFFQAKYDDYVPILYKQFID